MKELRLKIQKIKLFHNQFLKNTLRGSYMMNKFDLKKAAAAGLCFTIISAGSVCAMPKVISLNETPDVINMRIEQTESNVIGNAQEKGEIRVRINGEYIQLNPAPFIEDNRMLIPLRGVMEKLGAEVEWYAETETVEVHTKDISIELVVGETAAKVIRSAEGVLQEEFIQLEVPSKIVGERTFIPARFVAEALGASVDWDTETNTMIIETEREDDGTKEDEIGESLEEMGNAISPDSIKEMKLYSLEEEEIKTFTKEEIEEIINHLNTSPTYHGAYIAMLAGNHIKIILDNDDMIQLTSFGSVDYVIMSGEVNGQPINYCIMSPEVGSILLSQEN